MRRVTQHIDRLDVVFDEPNLEANPGLIRVALWLPGWGWSSRSMRR